MVCGAIEARCRHVVRYCGRCNKRFTVVTSYYRHIRHCTVDISVGSINPKIKLNLSLKTKASEPLVPPQHISKGVSAGPGLYRQLCDIIGTEVTLELIMNYQSLKIIEHLYLLNKEQEHPIASRGMDFRFRNAKQQIVEDIGGLKICKISNEICTNIALEASNSISEKLLSSGINDADYSIYMRLQTTATTHKKLDKSFIRHLAKMTNNPSHTFFKNGTKVVNDDL